MHEELMIKDEHSWNGEDRLQINMPENYLQLTTYFLAEDEECCIPHKEGKLIVWWADARAEQC